MTFRYHNVYVGKSSTVAGPYEAKGPLKNTFDKVYEEDLYMKEKSWEKAEVRLLQDSIKILLKKQGKKKEEIDLIIAGDLLNQISSSCYATEKLKTPFLGIYSACATSVEGMIIASTFIEGGNVSNCLVATSSHNMSSEKQFRNPTEYGAPKPKTATFTATGGACIYLSNEKSKIKVESATIGRIIDMKQNDPLHMGAVMAPAAADTIHQHLEDMKRDPSYYDLILTGDLGIYGKEILKDYMLTEYGTTLEDNYNDCGTLLYDLNNQKEVLAGGSGPVCSALVNYGHILKLLEEGTIKKVLLVTTGALFSPTFVYQKENILSIAHAISLEVVK